MIGRVIPPFSPPGARFRSIGPLVSPIERDRFGAAVPVRGSASGRTKSQASWAPGTIVVMMDDDDTGGMHEGPPRSTHPGEQAAAGQVPAAPGEPALSEQTLGEVLAQMSATEPGPAAGSAAAISVAISAALVAKTVRLSSRQLPDAEETAHAAQSLRERAVELAQA